MAKIQNPQNERGETLATDRRVNQLIEERVYPIEETLKTYNDVIIPGLKTDINNSKIDVSNLDDDDAETPLESFVNLNKINFVGRFVNVMSNEAGEITVYINEDNSLPAWDVENTKGGTSFTAIDANNNAIPSEKRYIYSPATGSNITGNTTYNYTAQTKGIHPLVIEYNGNPFNLTKSNYTFNVHYKINGGDEQIISLPLDKWIKADKIEESESDEIIESGLYFRYKKLGTDIINDGKTPGNIEVEAFKYTIPGSALAEGKITGIKVSFTHPFAKEYVLKNPYEIYLWTGSKTATGTLTVTPNLTETVSISGLKYINAASADNTIDIELEASNLADGALKSNTISLATSGISVNGVSNWTLTGDKKAHDGEFTKKLTLQNKSGRNKLTTSISIPNPFGSATTSSVDTSVYPIYGIEKSSDDLNEYFFDENKRLESNWTTAWNSATRFNSSRHGAVVQFGKLYHYGTSNTNWKDVTIDNSPLENSLSNYKNEGFKGESSYYRIFKGTSSDSTTKFYISGTNISQIFQKENDIELRIWAWNDTTKSWEGGNGWIANKVSTPSNDGLAADALENNKIKCTFKGPGATIINKGIRMKMTIKNKASIIDDLTITF
jgi:hypothetical protein